MTRKALSRLARVKIFDREGGCCHLCGQPINASRGELWELDHKIPLWMGGDDLPSNLFPVHVKCHVTKSAQDTPVKCKIDRIRAKHLGIKKQHQWRWPKRPFPKRKDLP